MSSPEMDLATMTLPVMPEVAQRILEIREDNIKVSSDQIGKLISSDPSLAGKILKIANSAYYSRGRKIAKLAEAITVLGIRTIKSLALLVTSAVLYTSGRKERLLVQEIWLRAVIGGLISRQVAQRIKTDIHPEDAFIAGLLGQTGFLVLLDKDTERFALLAHDIFQNKTESERAEQEKKIYGFSTADLTGKILQYWGLPDLLLSFLDIKNQGIGRKVHIFSDSLVYAGDLTGKVKTGETYIANRVEELNMAGQELGFSEDESSEMAESIPTEIKSDEFYKLCSKLVN
jgi:HD-like signal output (HDOD) protein